MTVVLNMNELISRLTKDVQAALNKHDLKFVEVIIVALRITRNIALEYSGRDLEADAVEVLERAVDQALSPEVIRGITHIKGKGGG